MASHRPGARTLTGGEYTDREIFGLEQERIFRRSWVCAGRAARLASPGDYFLFDLAGESVIVLRETPDRLRAFFNTCRHRGTRLLDRPEGSVSGSIRCPYHGWCYAGDGRLVAAPHMDRLPDFDRADYPLHEASIRQWEGFVFINMGEDAEPFESAWRPMGTRLARFGLQDLVVGHTQHYDIRANWKLVFQNYNECIHCPVIHPELDRVIPYDSGANDLVEGPFLGGYMSIREPHESATMSGRRCARFVSASVREEDKRRAYFYSLMPNLCLSIHPDYVLSFVLHPVAVDRTRLTAQWLFHPESPRDEGFDPDDAVRFWDATNRQDWRVVELGQKGVASSRYTPGPYSPRESVPAAWDAEYRRRMGR